MEYGKLLVHKTFYLPPCYSPQTPHPDPIGIPAVFLYLLVRQKESINPHTHEETGDSSGTQHVVVSAKAGIYTALNYRYTLDCVTSLPEQYPVVCPVTGW